MTKNVKSLKFITKINSTVCTVLFPKEIKILKY